MKGHHLRRKSPEHLAKLKDMLPRARDARVRTTKGMKVHTDETKRRLSERWKGAGNPNQNSSGRWVDRRGYVFVKVNDSWVQEHRLKGEAALGRPLKDDEVVHHIDEDKGNNENWNLLVCTDSYHKALHRRMLRQKRMNQ